MSDERVLPPGKLALAISTAVVRALANTTGRGPTKAKTTLGENAVFVVLQDTLTRGELKRRERENLRAALAQAGGKVFGPSGAAALLGMKPTTVISRIKSLGLERNKPTGKLG